MHCTWQGFSDQSNIKLGCASL